MDVLTETEKKRARSKEYYQKNKKKILRARKNHRKNNKEKLATYAKKYRENNLIEASEYSKEYRKNNKDKIVKRNKEYILKNKKKFEKIAKKHREENKEKYKQHREGKKEYRNMKIRERRQEDKSFQITDGLRGRIRQALKKGSAKKIAKTMNLTGCTIGELLSHLESKFTKRMTWKNYGFYGWHVDHIRPCASFDLTDPEQQKECFHYTNLQPLWAIDNLRKSAKIN